MVLIVLIIDRIIQAITLLVIVQALLSYFMDPFHPVRRFIDRLVEPMLAPIRRFIPRTGMLDFSPLVLVILLQVVDILVRGLLLPH